MCPKECAWENKPHEKCNLKKKDLGKERERERPTKAIFFLRDDLIFRKTL
jgi:hypothetical protein